MKNKKLTRAVAARVLCVVAGFATGIVILEAGVRLLMPQYSPANEIHFNFDEARNIFSGPRDRVIRQIKNTGDYDVEVKFNSEGFRDKRQLRDVGIDDWILVGDSFSFGWGVTSDQRFGNRLEDAIEAEVYNLTAPGNLVHYSMLLNYAEKVGADTSRVIVGLCVENDVLDYEQQQSGYVVETPMLVRAKRILGNNSAAWRALTTLAHSSSWMRDKAIALGAITPGDQPDLSTPSEMAIASTVGQLKRIAKSREMVVLIIPSRQVFVDQARSTARTLHQSLIQALTEVGIRVVDPLSEFDRSASPISDFHFRYDGHWSPLGHRIAAGVLVDALAHEALTDEPDSASSLESFAVPSIQ